MSDADHEKFPSEFKAPTPYFFRRSDSTVLSAHCWAASMQRDKLLMSESSPSGHRTRHMAGHRSHMDERRPRPAVVQPVSLEGGAR